MLKPGGRFAVSDVVVQGELPADVKRSMELWVGCVAGALQDTEFLALLRDAGFVNRERGDDASVRRGGRPRFPLPAPGSTCDRVAAEVAGRVGAAFVRATKPVAVRAARCRSPLTPTAVERLLDRRGACRRPGVREALARPASGFVVAESGGAADRRRGTRGLLPRRAAAFRGGDAGVEAPRRGARARRAADRRGRGARPAGDVSAHDDGRALLPELWLRRVVPREQVPAEVRATEEFRGGCPASAVAMVRPLGAAVSSDAPDARRGPDAGRRTPIGWRDAHGAGVHRRPAVDARPVSAGLDLRGDGGGHPARPLVPRSRARARPRSGGRRVRADRHRPALDDVPRARQGAVRNHRPARREPEAARDVAGVQLGARSGRDVRVGVAAAPRPARTIATG